MKTENHAQMTDWHQVELDVTKKMSLRTPHLDFVDNEEKREELEVYLAEVALKLQLMKDQMEMEERTQELRRELAETYRRPGLLPPLRHDLFLIRAGAALEGRAALSGDGGPAYDHLEPGPPAEGPGPRECARPAGREGPDEDAAGRTRRPWPGLRTVPSVRYSAARRHRGKTKGKVACSTLRPGRLRRRRRPRSGAVHLSMSPGRVTRSGADSLSEPSVIGVPREGDFLDGNWRAFTEGSLVWAKLGSSRWWPGMLVRGERGGMVSKKQPWVYWFGDHRISEVPRDKVTEFTAGFSALVQLNYSNKTYQLGLVEALRECRRRLGLDPKTGSFHQVIGWGRSTIRGPMTFQDGSIPSSVLSHLGAITEIQRECRDSRGGTDEHQEVNDQPRPTDRRGEWPGRAGRPLGLLETACLSCGSTELVGGHPLFVGGLCSGCQSAVLDTMFAVAEDGVSPYCVVCFQLGKLIICDETACNRGYCTVCLRLLIGQDAPERLTSLPAWRCPMCCEPEHRAMLCRRPDWKERVVRLFTPRSRPSLHLPTEQFQQRRPIRVLSLFDGIATGMHVLTQLGVEVDVYLAAEIDPDAVNVAAMNYPRVTQLGSVEALTDVKICSLAPIDLVLAGSPCVDLSLVNPARRGLYDPEGTGVLFFEFYRILRSVEAYNNSRHVFWLFENVASMPLDYRKVISRFLQMEPALIDAKHFSPQSRPRFFWGNIPGLYAPLPEHLVHSEHSIAPYLVIPSRQPAAHQVGCVTTSRNSLRQGHLGLGPVTMDGQDDVMWITEIEQMFGLPRHYTDLGSLGTQKRQQLLGRAWSAPVIQHILSSLRPFFATTSSSTSLAV